MSEDSKVSSPSQGRSPKTSKRRLSPYRKHTVRGSMALNEFNNGEDNEEEGGDVTIEIDH